MKKNYISHNARYVPSVDSVLLKHKSFRNECNEFFVQLFFDRSTGVVYYTISVCGGVSELRSVGFHSARNACADIRVFLRRMNCSDVEFSCREFAR